VCHFTRADDVRQLGNDFDAEEITDMGHVLERRAPLFLYVAVTVTLAGCMVYFGWVRTWSSVYVPFPTAASGTNST